MTLRTYTLQIFYSFIKYSEISYIRPTQHRYIYTHVHAHINATREEERESNKYTRVVEWQTESDMRPQSGNRGSERAREQNPRFSLSRVLARRAYRSAKLDKQCHGECRTFRQEETDATQSFPLTRPMRSVNFHKWEKMNPSSRGAQGSDRTTHESQYRHHHLRFSHQIYIEKNTSVNSSA